MSERPNTSKWTGIYLGLFATVMMWLILIGSGLTAQTWGWWQEHVVEKGYGGPAGMTPLYWWTAPALLVSFLIPAVSLSLPFLAGLYAYVIGNLLTEPKKKGC